MHRLLLVLIALSLGCKKKLVVEQTVMMEQKVVKPPHHPAMVERTQALEQLLARHRDPDIRADVLLQLAELRYESYLDLRRYGHFDLANKELKKSVLAFRHHVGEYWQKHTRERALLGFARALDQSIRRSEACLFWLELEENYPKSYEIEEIRAAGTRCY